MEADKKILIAEDDEGFVSILKENLENAGFSVISAENGEEGLKMAQEQKPDLILLDILMPKMNGFQMAKKLKEAGIKIPIIYLTNFKDEDHISQSLEISGGEADYIVKTDISIDSIIERIKKRLNV